MMDLPSGFPMYCKDLKQILDDKPIEYKPTIAKMGDGTIIGAIDPYFSEWKGHVNFPKQDHSKSHNAIEDARWNKKLYEFLNNL